MTFNLSQSGQRQRLRRRVLFALLLVAAWWLLAWGAARALIVRAELRRADAIIVLSGGSQYMERAQRAAALFREGRASRIVLTSDAVQGPYSYELERNPTYAEMEAEELRRAGVPAESIEVLPQMVSSTYDEAMLLRDYAVTQKLRSVLMVTSAYHSRRALWVWRRIFRESNVEIGIDPAPTGGNSPTPAFWWLSLRGWRSVAGEYPKFIYYWLRYF